MKTLNKEEQNIVAGIASEIWGAYYGGRACKVIEAPIHSHDLNSCKLSDDTLEQGLHTPDINLHLDQKLVDESASNEELLDSNDNSSTIHHYPGCARDSSPAPCLCGLYPPMYGSKV